jgi:hypothetical protein
VLTLTFANPVTAGSLIVVGLMAGDLAATVTSVKDNAASPDTYAQALAPVTDANGYIYVLYYFPNSPTGVTEIIITMSNNCRITAFAAEESAVASSSPLDGTPAAVAAPAATSFSSGNTTTSNANDVLYGFAGTSGTATGTWAVTGSWSLIGSQQNVPDGDTICLARETKVSAGSYAFTGTNSVSASIGSICAAFKQQVAVQQPFLINRRNQLFYI